MSTLNQPMWGRVLQSTVQTVLTMCLVGIYFQWVIPVSSFTIPPWSLWILNFPAWQLWAPFNVSFETTCSTPEEYPGLNPFSNDDTNVVCSVPWTYQSMIVGAFLASYGHLINDALYRFMKNAESSADGSIVGGAAKSALSGVDDAAETWHNNAAATLETMALGSSTGLIAGNATPLPTLTSTSFHTVSSFGLLTSFLLDRLQRSLMRTGVSGSTPRPNFCHRL